MVFVVVLLVFAVLALLRILKGRTGDFEYVFESATAVTLRENIYHYGQGINPYPPLTAAWVSLLVPLGEKGAAAVWLPLNVLGVGLAIWVGAREVLGRLRLIGREGESARDAWLVSATALATLVLVSEPVMGTIRRGNKDVFLLLPIALSLRWIDRRAFLAGALLAVGASVKYLTIVFLPYFLLRGRFKAAAGFLAGWVACALLPAIVMGWGFNLEMQTMAYGGVARMLGFALNDAGVANAAPLDLEITGASALQAIRRLAEFMGWSKGVMYGLVGVVALACVAIVWKMFACWGRPLFAGRFGAAESREERRELVLIDWVGLATAMLAFSLHLETRHTVLLAVVYSTAASLVLARGLKEARLWAGGLLRGVRALPWLVAATLASFLAYRLPPGKMMPELTHQWRYVGGSSWILLGFLMVVIWNVLKEHSAQKAQRKV
jgi:hypothetical protein